MARKSCHLVSVLCSLWLLGCGASESNRGLATAPAEEAPEAGPPAHVIDAAMEPSSSQPLGEVGAVQCLKDAECVSMAESELRGLTSAATPNAHSVGSGVCVGLGTDTVSGPACECKTDDGGSRYIGPSGAGCYVYGRIGECLFGDEEFSYCELRETQACSALCAELQTRLDADVARGHTGEVKYATCDQSYCHNVLQVDNHCYADRSYQTGRDYDCALSGPEILAKHAEISATKPAGEVVQDESPYIGDANGFVEIAASTQFIGTKAGATDFGAMAQLYSVTGSGERRAQIIDRLDGVDDCGVRRIEDMGTVPNIKFLSVDSALLIDGDNELPFELSSASHGDYYSYGIDLKDLGVTPRFGGQYGFRVGGGAFGTQVSVSGIELPQALSMPELERTAHVERGPLHLTWSGRNSEPLHLLMNISPQPFGAVTYTLECLMQDDGEFEIPEAVMQAVPNGIARAEFQREHRRLMHDGAKAILTIGRFDVLHEVAYGDRCEGGPVVEACGRYAKKMQQVYSDCAREAPPLDELCPDYIAHACTLCPEYYECLSRTTTCTSHQITTEFGCSCPK